MSRLAANRDTHLTRAEIAEEALRQFDERAAEPTIRSLAGALEVTPAAVYHHFPSRGAIVQAVVELVWNDALAETLRLVPAPLEADPVEVLVATGLATRRAWLAHHRVSRYLAATQESSEFTRTALGLMANLFERLGLEPEQAAASFHSYSSFMIGAVLFAADRKSADEQLRADGSTSDGIHAGPSPGSSNRTRQVIDEAMDLSSTDPARDEQLFEDGLRRLVECFTAPPSSPGS